MLELVLETVYDEVGGSFDAISASELPCDRRQIYNVRQHTFHSGQVQIFGRPDPFFDLIKLVRKIICMVVEYL